MEIAKWMLAVVAVFNYGGFLFDAVLPRTARMHLYNPKSGSSNSRISGGR
jgi:hypothetical protein